MTLLLFPQMFNPQVVKLYCMCLRTMKLWSKWLWKAEVQQWDMFPELIELLLIGCSIELILIQRSKSNSSTLRTDWQTSWQRGISHAMNGIICWPCLILAILALLLASQRWRNELNKNQEKDVSQPNHDLWWIWPQERLRSCLLQPHQTRGGPRMDIKILKKHVLDDRTGQPVEMSRSDFSQKDYGLSWSSQEWKSGDEEHDRSGQPDKNSCDSLRKVDPHRGEHFLGRTARSARNEETIHDRTGQPVSENIQGKADFENFIMGSETTEFVNKVRNQVRIRQKRMSSIAENSTKDSIIWRMFMATTLNAATFMGKNYSTMQNVVKNEESLTLKQMFDVTAQIVHNEEEIYCLEKIVYQKNSWTQLSLINDPVIINLQSTKVYVFFRFCVMSRQSSSTSWMQRSLEEQGCRSTSREKLQRFWGCQWRVYGIRVEYFPRIHIVAALWQNQQSSELFRTISRNFHRKNSVYVNVQWHLLWQMRQQRWMFKECRICEDICKKIWNWSMVFHWTRFWEKVVSFREQSTRSLGPYCGRDVTEIRRKWTSYFPFNDSTVQRKVEKQRKRESVYTLQCWSRYRWYNLSHYSFCQSAQYLRSSGSYMRWIWRPPREHGTTRCIGGTVNCSWRNQSRSTCSWWRTQRRSNHFAAIHSTSWIAFTRKQSE